MFLKIAIFLKISVKPHPNSLYKFAKSLDFSVLPSVSHHLSPYLFFSHTFDIYSVRVQCCNVNTVKSFEFRYFHAHFFTFSNDGHILCFNFIISTTSIRVFYIITYFIHIARCRLLYYIILYFYLITAQYIFCFSRSDTMQSLPIQWQ